MVFGVLFGGWHALWSVLVSMDLATPILDFVFNLHFLTNPYRVKLFVLSTAIELVVVTFLVGYVLGYIGALVWNWKLKR